MNKYSFVQNMANNVRLHSYPTWDLQRNFAQTEGGIPTTKSPNGPGENLGLGVLVKWI